MIAGRWGNGAATSRAPLWPTSACKPRPRVWRCPSSRRQARRHHAPADFAARPRAAPGGPGATPQTAPGSPACRSCTQRQVARAGGVAASRTPRAGRTTRRMRGKVCASPPRTAELGQALRKRVFETDLEHCPNCGGDLKIIAAIFKQPVIEKIVTRLGLWAPAPPRALARGSQLLQAACCPPVNTFQATRCPWLRGSAAPGLRAVEAWRPRAQEPGKPGKPGDGCHA